MRHPASCGILAGGASSRMGENKALLDFRGTPLIRRQIDLLSPMFEEVIIGANDPRPYAPFNVRVVPDLLTERCALTGIHALLQAATAPRVFVVACDMPFLHAALIERLLTLPGGHDVVVPETDRGLEPLHAVYGRGCIPAIEEAARRGSWKVSDVYDGLRVLRLRLRKDEWMVDGKSSFLNANTPEEWRDTAP